MTSPNYDCVIVGAGYAGLSAARALADKGKSVLVLEARDRVGGRAWTEHLDDGSHEDYGGMFLGVQQPNMHRLAKEYGIELFDTFTHGKSIFTYRGRSIRYPPEGLPPLSLLSLLILDRAIRSFTKASQSINLEEPWMSPKAKKLDMTTVEQWIRSRCWTRGARDTLRMAFELFWGRGAAQVSLLHALWYCKSGVSFNVLATIDDGAQQQLCFSGGQAIANALAEHLGDSAIHFGEAVVEIDQTALQAGGHVVVTTKKASYTAQRVIVAIPQYHIPLIDFKPSLPIQKLKLLENMPTGQYWKIVVTYDSPFWRDNGLRGEAVSPDGYMGLINDVSPPNAHYGMLVAFIAASKAMAFSELPDDEARRAVLLRQLQANYGPEAAHPKRLGMHTMMTETWSRGCPVSAPTPGTWTSLGRWMREPVGAVHWAGTETATRWSGYMEGAVNSGIRAAAEVMGKPDLQ